MKKVGVEKIICFVLIGIIVFEGIYIYLESNRSSRPKAFACSSAYACKCGESNELELCDCKYQDWQEGKIIERDIKCDNPKLEANYE